MSTATPTDDVGGFHDVFLQAGGTRLYETHYARQRARAVRPRITARSETSPGRAFAAGVYRCARGLTLPRRSAKRLHAPRTSRSSASSTRAGPYTACSTRPAHASTSWALVREATRRTWPGAVPARQPGSGALLARPAHQPLQQRAARVIRRHAEDARRREGLFVRCCARPTRSTRRVPLRYAVSREKAARSSATVRATTPSPSNEGATIGEAGRRPPGASRRGRRRRCRRHPTRSEGEARTCTPARPEGGAGQSLRRQARPGAGGIAAHPFTTHAAAASTTAPRSSARPTSNT